MVVISDVPMLSIGVIQERVGSPSTCTVQAPHSAMPQPNFVPVMPRTSRSTQSSGVSPSTSTEWLVPLMLISNDMGASGDDECLPSRLPAMTALHATGEKPCVNCKRMIVVIY